MTEFTIENGYYPEDHPTVPPDAIEIKGEKFKSYYYVNPRAGYYMWDSDHLPDGAVPIVKDGVKQWYLSKHYPYGR